jgi:long-chain fatty acid transport protein
MFCIPGSRPGGLKHSSLNKWHPVLAEEIVLEGDGNGVAYNAAVLYKHNSKFSFAANYRSQVKTDIEGDMTATLVFTGPVKTELTLPDTFQLGAAYKPNESWIISAEADYTNWTTYNEIVIKKQSDGSTVSTDYKDWKSVWAFRVGAEHKVNENWKLRAGTYYDLTPVLDHRFETRNPDSNRLAFSIGAGWTKGNLTVDASYLYLKFMERTITDSMAGGTSVTATSQTLNGTYSSIARLPAISVGYKF